jgi:hypothetical protein
MAVTYDVIELLAERGLILKYGEAKGRAIYFLLFGGYGIPGIGDAAEIVYRANEMKIGLDTELRSEMAAELAVTVLTEIFTSTLTYAGIKTVEALENPLFFFNILFSSEEIGDGELPVEIRKSIIETPAAPDPDKERMPGKNDVGSADENSGGSGNENGGSNKGEYPGDNDTGGSNDPDTSGNENTGSDTNSSDKEEYEKERRPHAADRDEWEEDKEPEKEENKNEVTIEEGTDEDLMEVNIIDKNTGDRTPDSPTSLEGDNRIDLDIPAKAEKERVEKEKVEKERVEKEKADRDDRNEARANRLDKYDKP